MSKTLIANSGIRATAPTFPFSLAADEPRRSIRVTGLTKTEAEDLLDWLEANGYCDYDFAYASGEGFTVSYSS